MKILNNLINFIFQNLIIFINFNQIDLFFAENFDFLVKLFHQTVNFFMS